MSDAERHPPAPPRDPFPGIKPFTYAHRGVFYARQAEVQALLRLVILYRGVLVYGPSQRGKSSLLNAGLIPEAIRHGYQPERIRVQPKRGAECVVERIAVGDVDTRAYLPSIFDAASGPLPVGGGDFVRVVALSELIKCVRSVAAPPPQPLAGLSDDGLEVPAPIVRPLLIFDQFEEWITAFEDAHARGDAEAIKIQSEILESVTDLINDQVLRVKVVLSFREDYLPRLEPFFIKSARLSEHYLRLAPLDRRRLYRLIRGPFLTYKNHYPHEIRHSLARTVARQFASTEPNTDLSLTELQIVCRSLVEQPALEAEFEPGGGGIHTILKGYFQARLQALPESHHEPAVALLTCLVTSAGTRRTVDRDNLLTLAGAELGASSEADRQLVRQTLVELESEGRLVRRERRRDLDYYEIASEFLIDWIKEQAASRREQRRVLEERRHAELEAKEMRRRLDEQTALAEAAKATAKAERTRRQWVTTFAGVALALLLVIIGLMFFSLDLMREQMARAWADAARDELSSDPQLSTLFAQQASGQLMRNGKVLPLAQVTLHRAVRASHLASTFDESASAVAVSPSGNRLALVTDAGRTIRVRSGEGFERLEGSFAGQQRTISAVQFIAEDGSALAVVNSDTSIERLDLTGGGSQRSQIVPPSGVSTGPLPVMVEKAVFGRRYRQMVLATYEPAPAGFRPYRRILVASLDTGMWLKNIPLGIADVAISDNGEWFAVARDGVVTLQAVAGGRSFERHLGSGSALQVSADGRFVLLIPPPEGDAKGTSRPAQLWNVDADWVTTVPLQSNGTVTKAAFNQDTTAFVVLQAPGLAQAWRIPESFSRQLSNGVFARPIEASGVAFSPDANEMLAWTSGQTAELWTLNSGDRLVQFAGHSDDIVDAVTVPRGPVITLGRSRVSVWSRGKYDTSVETGYRGLSAVAVSPDGRFVAASGRERHLVIANMNDGAAVDDVDVGSEVTSLAYSHDGSSIAVGTAAGGVLLYSNHTISPKVPPQSGTIAALVFSRDNKVVGYGVNRDPGHATVIVRNLSTGRVVYRRHVAGQIVSLNIAPDGTQIGVGLYRQPQYQSGAGYGARSGPSPTDKGTVEIQTSPMGADEGEAPAGAEPAQPDQVAKVRAAISEDLKVAVKVGVDNAFSLWRNRRDTPAIAFSDVASVVAVAPDGGHFAIGGDNGLLHLYAPDALTQPVPLEQVALSSIARPTGQENPKIVRALAFNSKGDFLAGVRGDGVITLYRVGMEALRKEARKIAQGRVLPQEECARYFGDDTDKCSAELSMPKLFQRLGRETMRRMGGG